MSVYVIYAFDDLIAFSSVAFEILTTKKESEEEAAEKTDANVC